MALETFNYIDSLVATNPVSSDSVGDGDNHIRGIKTTLGNTFPNITGAITSTQAELNYLDITTLGTVEASKAVTADASGDVKWGDSDKATFGAGSDLQIYHDGTHSYISEQGTGDLQIQATNLALRNSSGSVYFYAGSGGSVLLRHNNATKIETTSTGIDVTGTVTADGLTVDGDGYFGGSTVGGTDYPLRIQNTDTGTSAGVGIEFSIDGLNDVIGSTIRSVRTGAAYHQSALTFATRRANGSGLVDAARIDQNGDISFYEDTGDEAKFFWDASAESLGIGTTSPSASIHRLSSDVTTKHYDANASAIIEGGESRVQICANDSGNNGGGVVISNATKHWGIQHTGASDSNALEFGNYTSTGSSIDTFGDMTPRMRIDSSGNVDIKTGNLVIGTSGKGIDFSATANTTATGASMTSELLDDYEEGTWTPTLSVGTITGSASGTYTKIGNTVHAWFRAQEPSDNTSSAHFKIHGLPFDHHTDMNNASMGGNLMSRHVADTQSIGYRTGSDGIMFYKMTSGSWDTLKYTDMNYGGSSDLYGSVTYKVA